MVRREIADLSPDYVFQSKGRVTEYGYEVEVRIPFKSLRYQSAPEQSWGINVTRQVQHSGYEDSWAPARRASASFLAQSGRLVGLTDLRRGLVLDLNPVRHLEDHGRGGTDRDGTTAAASPELGGTVRWGITNNLSLNGTANPDFSQVESDAGQLLFDPRDELFFQEKRPFFLDGIEQFTTPNNLIYTRRIVQPVAAAKLTGKAFGTDIALLSAVDDPDVSLDRRPPDLQHPPAAAGHRRELAGRHGLHRPDRGRRLQPGARRRRAARVRRDLHRCSSRPPAAAPEPAARPPPRRSGRRASPATAAPSASAPASTPATRSSAPRSGFFPRPGLVHLNFRPAGDALREGGGSLMESVTFDVNLNGRWRYDEFIGGDGILDEQLHFNINTTLKGGWNLTGSLLLETFGYPVRDLRRLPGRAAPARRRRRDTVAFVGRPRIPNRDYVLSFETPEFKHFSANAFILWGNDENFFEWSPGRIIISQRRADLAAHRTSSGSTGPTPSSRSGG